MRPRMRWLILAVAAVVRPVAGSGIVYADSAGTDTPTSNNAGTSEASQSDVPPPANLMSLLHKSRVGTALESSGIDIYGHVEGGYTYEALQPNATDQLYGRRFDYISNRGLLNQAALNIERSTTTVTDHFDIGFRVQALEGSDAGFTESFQSYDMTRRVTPTTLGPSESDAVFDVGGNNSAYQFDLPDFYLDFNIPLARGIRIRAGRFEFFKPIDPNYRLFYSTTYAYFSTMPFTNMGITAAYDFNDRFGIEAGLSRGFNETVTDSNGSVDFIGKSHVELGERSSLVVTTSVGPELADDSRDYTALLDIGLNRKLGERLSLSLDGVYAHQFGNSTASETFSPFVSERAPIFHIPASYYGVSGALVQQINARFAIGGRLEWLRDDGGLITGIQTTLYEATVGSTITPFPHSALGQNFKIRPEVRYDYSNRRFFRGLAEKDQLTVAADVIYNF